MFIKFAKICFKISRNAIAPFRFIPESTRWLRLNGKSQEAVHVLKRIAKFNKKDVPDFKLAVVKQDMSKRAGNFFDLFRPRKIAVRSLIQTFAW